jgi:hypothetical protein
LRVGTNALELSANIIVINRKQIDNMQTQPKPKTGRPTGSRSPQTIRKAALKTLEKIMENEDAPPEARALAACKLIDEAKK